MADLVALLHAWFALFAVSGPILLTAGLVGNWRWVKQRAFLVSLAVAVLFVAGRAALDLPCPLSRLEARLRGPDSAPTAPWVTAAHVLAFRGTEEKTFVKSSAVWALFTFTLLAIAQRSATEAAERGTVQSRQRPTQEAQHGL